MMVWCAGCPYVFDDHSGRPEAVRYSTRLPSPCISRCTNLLFDSSWSLTLSCWFVRRRSIFCPFPLDRETCSSILASLLSMSSNNLSVDWQRARGAENRRFLSQRFRDGSLSGTKCRWLPRAFLHVLSSCAYLGSGRSRGRTDLIALPFPGGTP